MTNNETGGNGPEEKEVQFSAESNEHQPPDQDRTRAKETKKETGVFCKERPEDAREAVQSLEKAFKLLGLGNLELPRTSVQFGLLSGMGQTEIGLNFKHVVFDRAFKTQEGEKKFIKNHLKSKDIDYPGFTCALKHELAHIAMWSLTGLDRQPATRLLDEGFARLIEEAGHADSIDELISKAKEDVKEGLGNEETKWGYEKCLDLSTIFLNIHRRGKPPSNTDIALGWYLEDNTEYVVGEAFLLFMKDKFGTAAMVDLLKKSPQCTRRNDELTDGDFEPACVDKNIHSKAEDYSKIVFKNKTKGTNLNNPLHLSHTEAFLWEDDQFIASLEEITGQNKSEVKNEFRSWLGISK